VCLDETGKSRFYDLLYRRTQPIFYAFDLLWWDGSDCRERPLLERKSFLKSSLPAEVTQILYADHVEERGIDLFRKVCEMDLERVSRSANQRPIEMARGRSRSAIRTIARGMAGGSSSIPGGHGREWAVLE